MRSVNIDWRLAEALAIQKRHGDEAPRWIAERLGALVSCPLLSGPSTMTVWIKEGTTNAFEEA
jgi:hypothetical protein